MAFPERAVPSPLVGTFRTAVGRRSKGVPVAHLTGRREFYSLDLSASLETLVPRPETELLVELVLSRLSLADEPRVLDMGTGCGAIALVIKKERPRSDVTAIDKSPAGAEGGRGERGGARTGYPLAGFGLVPGSGPGAIRFHRE